MLLCALIWSKRSPKVKSAMALCSISQKKNSLWQVETMHKVSSGTFKWCAGTYLFCMHTWQVRVIIAFPNWNFWTPKTAKLRHSLCWTITNRYFRWFCALALKWERLFLFIKQTMGRASWTRIVCRWHRLQTVIYSFGFNMALEKALWE